MYRFAVVEDNPEFSNRLAEYFKQLGEETNNEFQIEYFSSGEQFCKAFKSDYDALYLDIMLPEKNGMEIAEEIRSIDPEVLILFVTNMAQYAVKGYTVNALDYILKPLSYPDFKNATQKALYRIARRQTASVTLNAKDGVFRVPISAIYYVEVQGHTVSFCTDRGIISMRSTLRDVESTLEGYNFCKSNNSYLVNLRYVTGVNKEEATVGPHKVPISRRLYNTFIKELTDYISKER